MPSRRTASLLLAVLFLALSTACSGGRPPPEAEGADASSAGTLSGASRFSASTVTVYRVSPAGQRGAQVAHSTTAADGTFTVPVGISEGPFLVVLTGGSTMDEATGATVQLGSDELTALVPRFPVGTRLERLLLSPISHFAAGLALRDVQAGAADVATADESAWHHLNAHFGGLDWRTTLPSDVTATSSPQLDAAAKAGLILAGLSQEALTISKQTGLTPGSTVTGTTLTAALYEDLVADGAFDGKGLGGQRLLLPAAGVLTPHQLDSQAVRFNLAAAIGSFLANERNTLRITTADAQPLLTGLSRSSSAKLFREPGVEFDASSPAVTVRISYQDSAGEYVFASSAARPAVRGRIMLEVDAQDEAGVTALRVTQQGAELLPAPRGNTPTHYQGTWDASLAADGELVFTVEATDGRGNKGTTLVPVLVDNTPPVISRVQPAASVYANQVRIEASATDEGSGVASLAPTGLSGFVDDADSPAMLAGLWSVPTQLADGPVPLTLKACDAVSNCSTESVTFTVDRTAPAVSLVTAPPRYTASSALSFTVEASDSASSVTAVRASRVGAAGVSTATVVPGSSGRRFSFSGLALQPGLNTFQVWAEDSLHASPPTEPLLVTVSRDNAGPVPGLSPVASYRDESLMDVERTASGPPKLPVVYTWPSSVSRASVTGSVSKALTRLSWGPTTPTGEELEGPNPQNVPFLSYSASRQLPEAEAPVTGASYSIRVSCPGCSFPAYTGNLIPSPRSSETRPTYLLPLTQETVPALTQLSASPAQLAITVTFTDGVGNSESLTHSVDFSVLAPPVVALKDTAYPSRKDPNSEYVFTLAGGAYAGMWGGTSPVRIARYVVHNPAPVPVRVAVSASGDWTLTERSQEVVAPPFVDTFLADGLTFNRTYSWATLADGAPPAGVPSSPYAMNPCGTGLTPPTALHLPGSSTAFTCRTMTPPTTRDSSSSVQASGSLTHAVYQPVSAGFEASPVGSSADTYEIPPQGQVVIFLVRQRGPARALPYVDLSTERGARVQTWNYDFWLPTSSQPKRCGWNGWCLEETAYRYSTELLSAQLYLRSSTLRISSASLSGGARRVALEESFSGHTHNY